MKRRLLSLAGAPALWMAHFVGVYGLASLACAAAPAWALAPSVVTAWGVAILTAAALALAGAGLLRNRRRLRGRADDDSAGFVARANVLLYGLSAVALLWVALPGLLLPACA